MSLYPPPNHRRQTNVRVGASAAIPDVPTTYDAFVNSFGSSVVSYWKFQNTGTDQKGVENATITGNPELNIETIVHLDTVDDGATTDGKCIAWSGNTGEYAQVNHNSLHKTADGTIVITGQCDRLDEKSTLLVGEVGGTAGGFAVEINTNGSVRAFLRNASSTPVTLVTNAGDVVLNQAFTVVFKWGVAGLSLSVWDESGAAIGRSVNLTMTGGMTDNTSAIRFGAYHTDVSHHDGPYGRVVWMNRRIDDEEEALLAKPRSVTRIVAAPQGVMTLPSLSEWLRSDVANPGTITKFVSNANRGNGSGSSAANAQEVQAALNGASAGQTFLAVCQTAGSIEFWNYPNGLDFPNGTSNGNRVTLQARQGDGVVISAGQDFAGARTPNSGFWTQSGLSQSDIDKDIWRSTGTFSGGLQAMMGYWIEFGYPQQIVRTLSMTDLRSAYSSSDSPTGYCGPSVIKNSDGRIYLRFQVPHPSKYSTDNKWSVQTWPGFPQAVSGGKLVYPLNQNPNNYVIHLFRISPTDATSSKSTSRGFTGTWIKVGAGINSMGHRYAIGGNNNWMDRGLHYNWHSFLEPSSTGVLRQNFFFNRVRSTDGSKIHLSRAEWKFGGHLEDIRTATFRAQNSNTMDNVYCKDCTFGDWHEIMVGNAGMNNFRFRNCTFVQIFDDGMQTQHNASRHEWGYCYYYNSAYGGLGQTGSEGDAATPLGWYFHHNIIDVRQERGTNWRAQPHPHVVYSDHSPDGRSPHKVYNNLVIWGPDTEEEKAPSFEHCPGGGTDNTLTGAANMHEVFNNIMMRVFLEGTKRYDAISSLGGIYSDNAQNRSDYVNGNRAGGRIRFSASFSNELFDYNLYWRHSGLNVNGLLRNYARGSGQTALSFASLAAWKAHAEFAHSKLSGTYRVAYSPGFDGNSTETKPTIPTIDNYPVDRFKYRPAATSAVTTAKTGSLSGANWWTTPPTWGATYFPWNDGAITLAPSPWKGPLDPNGTTLPVGVQNP
jgi:hypothetical protein